MTDLVLDVGALAEVIDQIINCDQRNQVVFRRGRFISGQVAYYLNQITRSEGRYRIVASALAFVELAHKWDEIVDGRFGPGQLAAFLNDPPEWFLVAAVDQTLLPSLCSVPSHVCMPDGRIVPIEWTDAVHAATALSRDGAVLVTTDGRLRSISHLPVL